MTDDTTLIALCGQAGAGKDSVADVLCTHAAFTRLAFADALRDEVAHAFKLGAQADILTRRDVKETPTWSLAIAMCDDRDFARAVWGQILPALGHRGSTFYPTVHDEYEAPRTPRQILQWWGTEYRRAQDSAYWTRALARRLQALHADGQRRIVITDCRYPNEAALVRGLQGQLWRIERPGLPPVEGQHSSASAWHGLTPDITLYNNSDIPALCVLVMSRWDRLERQRTQETGA